MNTTLNDPKQSGIDFAPHSVCRGLGTGARQSALAVLLVIGCPWGFLSFGAERVPLLHVSLGQLPNDTTQEDQTKLTIAASHPEFGGKALKAICADGDTFGMSRGASVRNWKPFVAVEFAAFNPSPESVKLTFVVRVFAALPVILSLRVPGWLSTD